jgi:hypothetical protein
LFSLNWFDRWPMKGAQRLGRLWLALWLPGLVTAFTALPPTHAYLHRQPRMVLATPGRSLPWRPVEVAPSRWAPWAGVREAYSAYRGRTETHYLQTACVQGGLIRVGANYVAQSILVARGAQGGLSAHTLLAMLALGATVSGVVQAAWTRFLDRAVGHRRPARDAALKALIDYVAWSPLCNSAYLIACPLARGEPLLAACELLAERFVAVQALELACFAPYNLVAYSAIPLALRPLGTCTVAAVFTIGLSFLC